MIKKIYIEDLNVIMLFMAYSIFGIYDSLGISPIYNAIFFIISALSTVLLNKKVYIDKISCSLLLLGLLTIINIRNIEVFLDLKYYILSMLVVIWNSFFGIKRFVNKNALKIIMILGIISSIYIYIYILSINIYNLLSKYILSINQVNYNLVLINCNYAPSFAGKIGITADYIVVAIFITMIFNEVFYNKNVQYFVLMFLIIALIILARRGELLMFLVDIVLVNYLLSTKDKKIKQLKLFLFLVVICVIGLIIFNDYLLIYSGENRYIYSLKLLLQGADITNGRYHLYDTAYKLFLNNKFIGIGWGEFAKYGKNIIDMVTNVHCIYLQLFCEIGIISGSIYIYILGYIYYLTYNKYKSIDELGEKTNKYRMFLKLSLLIQTYILLKGVIDNSIYYSNFYILYFICVYPMLYRKKIDYE